MYVFVKICICVRNMYVGLYVLILVIDGWMDNCIECKRYLSIYMNLDYVFDDIRFNCLYVYIEYSCLLFLRVNRYIF